MQTGPVLTTCGALDIEGKRLVLGIVKLRTVFSSTTCAPSVRTAVESRKGAVPKSYCMPTRFPSPLIKPDVPIYRMKCVRTHFMRYVVFRIMWRPLGNSFAVIICPSAGVT